VRTREGVGARARAAAGSGAEQPDVKAEYEEDDYEYDEDEEYEELSPVEAARAGARHIGQLTGKELCGVVSLGHSEDGWLVGVEVVEDRRIPSSNDVLGLYEIEVDADGELVSYRRSRRYARGRGESSEVI
jgi:Gas vesicle synthesis protein GvpO